MKKASTFSSSSAEEYLKSSNSSIATSEHSETETPDSAFAPPDSKDFRKTKLCYICDKKFNLTSRRHHCRFCSNSVCDEHSLKRRALNNSKDLYRICDNCERLQLAEEVRREIQEQLDRLQVQLDQLKDSNDKIAQDNLDKIEQTKQQEMELKRVEKVQEQKEEELSRVLKIEQEKGIRAKNVIQHIQKEFDEIQISETSFAEKCRVSEDELNSLRNQVDEIRDKKDEIVSQVNNLTEKLKTSLPLDDVTKLLCQRCQKRVNEFYKNDSVVLPDDAEGTDSIINLIKNSKTGNSSVKETNGATALV